MEKSIIRESIAERARGLQEEYLKEASERITGLVIGTEQFKQAEGIFVYISLRNEPETRGIIEEAWRRGKRVYVPRCRKKPIMEAVLLESFDQLEEKKFGLLEPGEKFPGAEPCCMDLALIPCVSADTEGGRIGHGAGYYDNFLRDFSGFKLCLCYGQLLSSNIPMDENDIKMDALIDENGFHKSLKK